jgi:hypothetical protein
MRAVVTDRERSSNVYNYRGLSGPDAPSVVCSIDHVSLPKRPAVKLCDFISLEVAIHRSFGRCGFMVSIELILTQ